MSSKDVSSSVTSPPRITNSGAAALICRHSSARSSGGRKQIPIPAGNDAVYGDEQQRRAGDQDQLENKDKHARGGEFSFSQRDLYGIDKGKKYEDLQDHLFTSCIGSRPEFFPI